MNRSGRPWEWRVVSIDPALRPMEVELVASGVVKASVDLSAGRYMWHTFGNVGFEGESGEESTLEDAKRAAIASIVVQGWAPGGWRVTW